ncbi:hypothetical protein H0E87_021149 [Populus deltoides]|uniref:SAUR family protein n=1 Tax=Populus deltoides TaxID=3696 RepID=A0A8T2XRQ5_POPDE|nr:hypothetical protein H0E87_021149 [Populus deltoides]
MWKGRGFGSVTKFPRSQILSATHEFRQPFEPSIPGSTCPTLPADVNNDIAPTMAHLATPIAVIPSKINLILRKCKSLSRQLGRSSSYSSLRSKSTREDLWGDHKQEDENHETIFVGSTRKRYVISSKYLSHPLVNALIEKSRQKPGGDNILVVKCEVVFFDHLLWMLENADPNASFDSLEELADLYMF